AQQRETGCVVLGGGSGERVAEPAGAGSLVRSGERGREGAHQPPASAAATTAFGGVRRHAARKTASRVTRSSPSSCTFTHPKRPTYGATETASGNAAIRSVCCALSVRRRAEPTSCPVIR